MSKILSKKVLFGKERTREKTKEKTKRATREKTSFAMYSALCFIEKGLYLFIFSSFLFLLAVFYANSSYLGTHNSRNKGNSIPNITSSSEELTLATLALSPTDTRRGETIFRPGFRPGSEVNVPSQRVSQRQNMNYSSVNSFSSKAFISDSLGDNFPINKMQNTKGKDNTIREDRGDRASKTELSKRYLILKGDTLTKIAKKFNVSFIDIAILNNIDNPNDIPKGKVLNIPSYLYL